MLETAAAGRLERAATRELDFGAAGVLERATTGGLDGGTAGGFDGGLVLARGRTLSRHRRIPSLQLSPVVSERSTGRWKLARAKTAS